MQFDVSPEAPISIILTSRILALIQESGATQMEALCALGAASQLLPVLGASLATPRSEPSPVK